MCAFATMWCSACYYYCNVDALCAHEKTQWKRQKCNQCAVVTTWWEGFFFTPLLLLLRYVGNCYCCSHIHRDRKAFVSSSISNCEPNLLSIREMKGMRQRARKTDEKIEKWIIGHPIDIYWHKITHIFISIFDPIIIQCKCECDRFVHPPQEHRRHTHTHSNCEFRAHTRAHIGIRIVYARRPSNRRREKKEICPKHKIKMPSLAPCGAHWSIIVTHNQIIHMRKE